MKQARLPNAAAEHHLLPAKVLGPLGLVIMGLTLILILATLALTVRNGYELVGQSFLISVAIAALFIPIRDRIQKTIDRRFNRNHYDAQQVLSQFANTVRDETDLEKLTGELVNVIHETMQPTTVSVWLKGNAEQTVRARNEL